MKDGLDSRHGLFIALLLAVLVILAPGASSQTDRAGDEQTPKPRIKKFRMSGGPEAVVSDGQNLWVANRLTNTVTKLKPEDGTELAKVEVGSRPSALAYDGTEHLGCQPLQQRRYEVPRKGWLAGRNFPSRKGSQGFAL